MYAIIKIKNKQYKIKENRNIYIDKINYKTKKEILIKNKNIILIFFKKKIFYKKEDIKLFLIKIKILKHTKDKKINIIKFKRRKNYKKKYGHRQQLTKIKIKYIRKKNGT